VIDGLECFVNSGIVAKLLSIRQLVSGNPQTIILSSSYGNSSFLAVQSLIKAPIKKLPLDNSVTSQKALAHVKVPIDLVLISKLLRIYTDICLPGIAEIGARDLAWLLICLVDIRVFLLSRWSLKSVMPHSNMAAFVKSFSHINQHSDGAIAVSVVTKEEICKVDVGELETIVFVNLPTSIDEYTQVLAGMARHSVQGVLHSFYSKADASLAGPLINVLEQCQQVVPESLRLLADAHSEVGPA
ncbi:ATP-dependent RNA helicase, partial [Nymphaea thermarum]